MWARAVYPFDFPPTMVGRWAFFLFGYAIGAHNNTVESKSTLGRPVIGRRLCYADGFAVGVDN
jgi:hypothetical protein